MPWEQPLPLPRTEVIIFPNDDGTCQVWCNDTMGDGDAYWEGWHSPMPAKSWWQTPAPSWTLIGFIERKPDSHAAKEFWSMPNGYAYRSEEGHLQLFHHACLDAGSTTRKGQPSFSKSTSKGASKGIPSSSSPESTPVGKGPRQPSGSPLPLGPKGQGQGRISG